MVRYDFHHRTAIVTGGASGIGRAIAERLRDSGAEVWVWDLRPPPFSGVRFAEVDVASAASVAHAAAALPGVDILVNNAGFAGRSAALTESDPAEWRRIVEVNLFGTYQVCRAVVPLMQASPCGRVVNMASLAGKEGTPMLSAYAAAKAGVIALTKSLGKELAATAIRVNAIAPAAVATELLLQLEPAVLAGMIAKSPLQRLGTVDEIAGLALWLCSDECGFSTGAVFDASGGRATY